jgi:cytosine/adenosine deaminase-related metal-dependent hydrolase
VREIKEAMLFARLAGGPRAMTARRALAHATVDGARCLGRADEIGSLEPGKSADVALWRLDTVGHAGIDDPVAALVLGPEQRVDRLLIDGATVVEGGRVVTVDEQTVASELARASRRVAERAGLA